MRSRNIKPDYFRDYQLCQLDIYARVLFSGLWCLADRDGRLEDCPPRIRADVFPYDNVEIEKLLESLATSGFITRYTVEGDSRRYIQIRNFHKHQNPHKNEKPSEIPAVDNTPVITRGAPVITGADRADSLNLIPDSLNLIPDSKTKPTRFCANVFLADHCANKQLISDWLKVRKTKKAANTQTAMNLFISQVEKSGLTCEQVLEMCCEKSWSGFKAEWLQKQDSESMSQTSKGLAILAEMRRRANEVDDNGDNNGNGAPLLLEVERLPSGGPATENHARVDKIIDAAAWPTRNRAG